MLDRSRDFLIDLNGISKNFKTICALDNVSFGIRRGEIFGYIGPNGAGKTTTIKIMVGLIRDFKGSVEVAGNSVKVDRDSVQKILGYLPQHAAFQEWRTVEQALTTFGRLNGLDAGTIERRIAEVLQLLSISDTRNRRIVHLSGGTVQKVGLAQAILHEPELLILDEPMAGLDPASRYQFKNILKELGKQGITIFFSSHILSDVQDIANRIGILNRGRIGYIGTLEELKTAFKVPKDIDIMLSHDATGKDTLAGIAGVMSVDRIAPNRYLAHLEQETDIDEAVDALVKNIMATGSKIRFIYPVNPNLEEVYVRYVGGVFQ